MALVRVQRAASVTPALADGRSKRYDAAAVEGNVPNAAKVGFHARSALSAAGRGAPCPGTIPFSKAQGQEGNAS